MGKIGKRRGRLASFGGWLSTLRRDVRGTVAVMFAIIAVVAAPIILGLFDVYTSSEQRARLQDALDAAALYAARSSSNDPAVIDQIGDKALDANLHLLRGATLLSSDFTLTDNDTKVVATATIQPVALAPTFWGHPPVTVHTDVVRASKNLEVALVLDVTGSMNTGTRIADLRTAGQALVDLVVKDQQTPFYSKVAVIPWSMGVNVGSYADSVHGAVSGTRTISDVASWKTGSQKTVSGVTRANPAVVTANSHGFVNGDKVMITGATGMTQLNGVAFTVANKTTNTFQLQGVNSSGWSSYNANSAKVTKCVRSDCTMQVTTSSAHGYANGAYIYLNSIGPSGLGTALNDKMFAVSGVTSNTFNVFVASGPTTAYTSGGVAYCTDYGCEYYRFLNGDSSATKLFRTSSCVSERTGAQAYTDAAPSGAPVGFNYPATSTSYAGTSSNTPNPCLGNQIVPLSTDKAGIKTMIGNLVATGSTAGQVGVAWGWYMVSPNFAYLWPTASQPAAYNAPNTIKAVVLMTDGALNSPYCTGVIAKDAISGSGSIKDHNNCNATNGTTLSQSLQLCQNMKTAGVIVYSVGFQITGDTNAETLINTCATSAKHVYLPTSGAALSDAFKAIGAELNNLRLAR